MYPSIESIEKALIKAIETAVVELPSDVREYLEKAYHKEEGLAKAILKTILDNVKVASEERTPLCQDTGLLSYYVRVGTKFPYIDHIYEILRNATIRATKEIPLRPNAVNVVNNVNSGDNTGYYVPIIDIELIPNSRSLEVIVMPKGGGSESPSISKVLTPAQGIKEAMKIVIKQIAMYAINSCPPIVVGIGIGGTFDCASQLARKALLRRLGRRSSIKEIAELEITMLNLINELGIGVQGVGGRVTALDVHIEIAHRHPATLAMALCVSCWALRRAIMKVNEDGEIKISSYSGDTI